MPVDRVRSRHGNVIAADFRRRGPDLTVTFETETLYRDPAVVLTRTTARLGPARLAAVHFLGDLATGAVTHLTTKDRRP